MKFELGQYVEVIRLPKFGSHIEQYVGAIGKIVSFTIETVGGTEEDPEIHVRFEDGSQDMFWEEELIPYDGLELNATLETNSSVYTKQHWWEIAMEERRCTYCPPHGGENETRHKPKSDKYKNKR